MPSSVWGAEHTEGCRAEVWTELQETPRGSTEHSEEDMWASAVSAHSAGGVSEPCTGLSEQAEEPSLPPAPASAPGEDSRCPGSDARDERLLDLARGRAHGSL